MSPAAKRTCFVARYLRDRDLQRESGLPTRYTLIFDSDTGKLLGYEEMLTKDPGKLNVPIPSVISYTVYLESGYTSNIGRNP